MADIEAGAGANTAKYIDAEKLINAINLAVVAADRGTAAGLHPLTRSIIARLIKLIENQPVVELSAGADVVEVRHGKWEKDENKYRYCSNCKEYSPDGGIIMTPYCPCCGAKMDAERKEK